MPNGKSYTYIQEQTAILDGDQKMRITVIEGKHLILMTCYPFFHFAYASKKFVVTCTIQ